MDNDSPFTVKYDGSLVILGRHSSSMQEGDGGEDCPEDTPSESSLLASNRVYTKQDCVDDYDAFQVASADDDDEEGNGISKDISMQELEQLVQNERENLRMILESNDQLRIMMTNSNDGSPTKPASMDAAVNTSDADFDPDKEEEGVIAQDQDQVNTEAETEHDGVKSEVATVKPYQKMLNRMSFPFRRRRRANLVRATNENPVNVQAFFRDYYRSLDTVSRYIIAASTLGFLTAFLLLSSYSAQTHSNDMELFGLKEKRIMANQEAFDRYQLQTENLREDLMHLRYEESRECQSVLQSCYSKRDELFVQISKLEQDSESSKQRLEAKLQSQRREIQVLEGKLRQLQEQNTEFKKEIGQTFSSSYARLLFAALNFVQNRTVQIIFGAGLTMVVLLGIIATAFSK